MGKIILETPCLPEKAGEVYHVVSMEWFAQWKAYTDYIQVMKTEMINGGTPQGTEEAVAAVKDSVDGSKNLPAGSEALHPGPINNTEQLEKLDETEQWLKHNLDTIQIKTSCKEDEDFVLLPDAAWKLLFEIYGGLDIPRYSIEVATDSDSEDKQFIVEVFYQRLQLYILPKSTNHLILRKPSALYISRKATVIDYHTKMVEILVANNNHRSVEELLSMSRIWRLDTGESVLDIEKDYDYEKHRGLPLQVRGRILEDN